MTTPADSVVDRVFTTLLLQTEAATMTLGDRLGLWTAFDGSPRTPAELAADCAIAPRYAREWCEAMATSGYLEHTDGRFRVSAETAAVLVDTGSPTYLMPLLRQMIGATASLRRLERAYRTGGGVRWAEFDPDVRDGQGASNAVALREDLPGWVAAHLPEVAARLRAGDGRVADVGCGHGWASVGLARAFPAAAVDAFDLDGPSIAAARHNAAGLPVRAHARALGPDDGPYDLVVMAEMLHDVPDPVGLLRSAADVLKPDGVLFVADMATADELQTPGDEVERLLYSFSLLVCLPDAMSTPGSAGTGTVMRRGTFERYVADAGLRVRDELPIENDFWRFSVLVRVHA